MNKVIIFLLTIIATICVAQDASGDFQNLTYVAKVKPVTDSGSMSITTYFSPDTSIQTETNLIQNAQESIDIAIPGFDSWNYCTDTYEGVYGCTVANQRSQETFPIFQALLNAIHRGVAVRIISNNFYSVNETLTSGYIDPLSFLALTGAQVRYFTTLTFLHSKYMNVDGKQTSISSINFSQTSFMKNREAGVIVQGSSAISDFTTSVFELDWDLAIDWPTISYSASDMSIITDKTPVTVNIPQPTSFPGSYVTKATTTTGNVDAEVFTSPDNAWTTVSDDISSSKSLKVYIYQITDQDWCDFVGNYTGELTILVSSKIYSHADYESAYLCYSHLYGKGITIRKTASNMYTYSHQKYWILDDNRVYVSTGNWGDTDYPTGSNVFPAYNQSPQLWRKTNRDFTIKMQNSDIVDIYSTLFEEDYSRGYDWYP
ncbi:phospholipase D [Cavenderia fasciculata]|uniref:Mitochondrial cardiolipin hydrolase n=1 Tax=Cavenderia fasciculata TaxID=261658 RepID=F4PHZ7_CACFS|nr:phospholipase D [Cavenderia fasciculata]EGG24484.1 phospholipase D [Cavenderia fasciculata]|eukprot:XP_004362335.1 phospholipase D [Cavenderia fasciculata]